MPGLRDCSGDSRTQASAHFESWGKRKCGDRLAEFASRHIVQRSYQRRLIDVAQSFGGSLGQSQPVVPIAHRILQPFQLSDKLRGLGRFRCKLGCIARPLYRDAVLMQHIFRHRACRAYDPEPA